uniref:Uncharacterized protein n=1 Tax=Arundo donax TaxID=35708 RepID=A0A0A9EJ14_ARUDO
MICDSMTTRFFHLMSIRLGKTFF